ncbi:MAG: nickel-dependent lactate racemase [Chloroflexi bacterium]|nr:nickel-dependent lactate racemase [Chloroflexota bacterium]
MSEDSVNFELKYGMERVPLEIPRANLYGVIQSDKFPVPGDPLEMLGRALTEPIGCPALPALVGAGKKVTIVTGDITRLAMRNDLVVPFLISHLNESGIRDEDITILVGTGNHRQNTLEEHQRLYGGDIIGRIKVENHDCMDDSRHEWLGTTSRGTKVHVNRRVLDADCVILVGGITHHLLAGFSGGRKAICPGACHLQTIQQNHSYALGTRPGEYLNPEVQPGRLKGNPVAEDLDEVVAMVEPDFIVNTIVDGDNRIVDVVAGHWRDAFIEGCRRATQFYTVSVDDPFDVAFVSCGGYPKDVNMVQTARVLSLIAPVVKDGGMLVVVSEARDGMGSKEMEEWFATPDVDEMSARLRQSFSLAGHLALDVVLKVKRTPTFLLSRSSVNQCRLMGVTKIDSLSQALKEATRRFGPEARMCVVPAGKAVFPLISVR